jgi:signal transduction histidine kinase
MNRRAAANKEPRTKNQEPPRSGAPMKPKQTSTRTMPCAFSALAILLCLCSLSSAEVLSRQTSISKHKQQLAEIDSQLTRLANYNPRSGVGVGGYRSSRQNQADHLEWVEIDLGQTYKIDEVILVPEIRRSTNTTLLTDGFPEAFRILAGTAADQKGKVIASYTSDDNILPRIAPLAIACAGIEASWIRLETTTLSPRAWNGGYALHLFEMLVFSGHENVALHQPVKASSQNIQAADKHNPALLVDGFLPYVMDTAKGERSPAFVATSSPDQPGYLSIDLGKAQTLDQVHLHAVDLSDAIPQKRFNNFGMPRHMIVEGANAEDFNDAITLTEFKVASVFEAGPILMKRFPATTCRYVRLRVLEPSIEAPPHAPAYNNIGFAEIELLSRGINVAKTKEANGNYGFSTYKRTYSSLTDGRNFYGDILPIRLWLNELALRHELERQRPQLALRLNELYEEQKSLLNRFIALAVILAVAMIIILLVARITRMRQLARVRLRLAADLHDELGANLHTIGLLSDLATESREDDEAFADIQRRIRSEADRSGAEVRGCMDLLALNNYYENLEADMQRAARRIMAKLDHELIIEGEPYLQKLKPRVRVDLFLFYKECLVNISRHASATAFSSHLSADKAGVSLIIRDNGIGISVDAQQDGMTPTSLERRAGLLRAKVRIDHPSEGGTVVTLTIPAKRLGIFKSIYL